VRKQTWVCLVGWVAATAPVASVVASGSEERYEFSRVLMGVPFKITLYAADAPSANRAADAAYDRIAELNAIFSDYDSDSESMRLCAASRPGTPVVVSPELMFVLSRSLALSESSGGAFDVTVGPLVKLWRRAGRQRRLPADKALQEARQRVGYRLVRLDCDAGSVELLSRKMRLDFGGIAKGYAADEALRVLKRHGCGSALINAGGDVVAGDPPRGQPRGWRIGIAPVDQPEAAPKRFLRIANAAVATSGDAFQFVEIGGVRYSHILDPHTGLGLTISSSVTVIAPDGITADSLASAVSVLGSKPGMALVEITTGTAALFVEMTDASPRSSESSRFTRYLEREE